MEAFSDKIVKNINGHLDRLSISDECKNVIYSTLKVIIAYMIKGIVITMEKNNIIKAKSDIIKIIKIQNPIFDNLKINKNYIYQNIDFTLYIFDIFTTQRNYTTITKGLIEKMNGVINYYFIQLYKSSVNNKLTKQMVINELNNIFPKDIVLLILKCDEESYSHIDSELNGLNFNTHDSANENNVKKLNMNSSNSDELNAKANNANSNIKIKDILQTVSKKFIEMDNGDIITSKKSTKVDANINSKSLTRESEYDDMFNLKLTIDTDIHTHSYKFDDNNMEKQTNVIPILNLIATYAD